MAAAIMNHSALTAQAMTGTTITPKANATGDTSNSSSSDSSSSSAAITANDFLTLLVTEMKNQDPTATTDPNEYINQLVQVNSLQQLISINQNLSTALGISSTGTNASAYSASPATGSNEPSVQQATEFNVQATGSSAAPAITNGNLGIPDATPAALRIAQALSGQAHSAAGVRAIAR